VIFAAGLGSDQAAGIPLSDQAVNQSAAAIPTDTVIIKPLPSLRRISGYQVPFSGKVTLPQAIAGRFAKNLTIVNFAAVGDRAEKSAIKIVWENGEVERITPGTQNKQFAPERRAVEITIEGYSVHERRLFKDSARPGTLTWEIRYEPVAS
jgi:hypothetical protein